MHLSKKSPLRFTILQLRVFLPRFFDSNCVTFSSTVFRRAVVPPCFSSWSFAPSCLRVPSSSPAKIKMPPRAAEWGATAFVRAKWDPVRWRQDRLKCKQRLQIFIFFSGTSEVFSARIMQTPFGTVKMRIQRLTTLLLYGSTVAVARWWYEFQRPYFFALPPGYRHGDPF